MAWIKRIGLFFIINFLVVTTVGFIMNFALAYFGIELGRYGYYLIFYSIFGMGSALVSLFASKKIAKWSMKVQIVDPKTASGQEKELLDMVYNMSRAARISKMPEFGIYNSPEVNAFATGPSKNSALVAVSTGLLQSMNKDQVEGVIGHEIAHVTNGDMVTMTLITGMMNTMVLFLARILSDLIAGQLAGENKRPNPWLQFGLYMGLQIVLNILGSIVVSYFSRKREYRADAGGAKYAGRDKMISALKALASNHPTPAGRQKQDPIAALKISGVKRSSLAMLLATHPPIEQRIRVLEQNRNSAY